MIKSGLRIETFQYASCNPVLDKIDKLLSAHYGFSAEELGSLLITTSNTAWAQATLRMMMEFDL
jgi:hypothetical protein